MTTSAPRLDFIFIIRLDIQLTDCTLVNNICKFNCAMSLGKGMLTVYQQLSCLCSLVVAASDAACVSWHSQMNRKAVCRKEKSRTLWTPCSISQSVGCLDFYRSGQMPRLEWTEAAGGGLTADGKSETSLLFTSQLVWWAPTRFPFGGNCYFDLSVLTQLAEC